MKLVKILGFLQIIVAVALIITANEIDPGVSVWSAQFVKTSRAFSQTTKMHKEAYSKSVQNIGSLKTALADMGKKTQSTASAITLTGQALQKNKGKWYYPDAAVRLGVTLNESGQDINAVATALTQQSELLEQYQQEVYPQTLSSFDEAIKALDIGADALEAISSSSKANFTSIVFLAGLFFFLNGIALMLIPGKVSTKEV